MKELPIRELSINTTFFGEDWAALSAGTESGYNAMTIAWGQMGSLWNMYGVKGRQIFPTATVYVRPHRYTKEFMDREPFFALNWFGGGQKKALGYLGSHSGRDGDKAAAAGLTPVFSDGTVYFQEAKMVVICRKIYQAPLLESGFVDTKIDEKNYPLKDYHEMYIGEIVRVLAED